MRKYWNSSKVKWAGMFSRSDIMRGDNTYWHPLWYHRKSVDMASLPFLFSVFYHFFPFTLLFYSFTHHLRSLRRGNTARKGWIERWWKERCSKWGIDGLLPLSPTSPSRPFPASTCCQDEMIEQRICLQVSPSTCTSSVLHHFSTSDIKSNIFIFYIFCHSFIVFNFEFYAYY